MFFCFSGFGVSGGQCAKRELSWKRLGNPDGGEEVVEEEVGEEGVRVVEKTQHMWSGAGGRDFANGVDGL